MKKTANSETTHKMAVDTKELQAMLGCGRDTACKVGTEAKARLQFGKRVLWNVAKVQAYLDSFGGDGWQTGTIRTANY